MAATKVGNSIYVDGLGNTLASVTSDIADITWIEDKGAGVYELKANHILDIRPDGELIVGDPLDYSTFERLDMVGSSNNSLRLFVRDGAKFRMYGNTEIDFNAGSYYASFEWYDCLVIMDGDATYRPKFSGLYYNRSVPVASSDPAFYISVNKADFEARTPAQGSGWGIFEFNHFASQPATFTDCVFDGNPAWTSGQGRGRPPYRGTIYPGSATGSDVLLTDCVLKHFDFTHYQVGNLRYVNCQFIENDDRSYWMIHNPLTSIGPWEGSGKTPYGQDFALAQGCLWSSSNGGIGIYAGRGALLVLKDCITQGNPSGNVQITQNCHVFIWTGNTIGGAFADTSEGTGFIAYVYAMQVIVEDEDSNPIEGASVVVRQKDNFEEWRFTTLADGKINGSPLLDGQVLCVHKVWVSGDPVTGTFTYKSDTSNGTYHRLIVSAPGYETQELQIVMDADKSQTVTLQKQLYRGKSRVVKPVGRMRTFR